MLNKNITILFFQIIKSLIKDNMYRSKCYEPILKYFMMLLTLVLIVVPVIFIINLYKTSESAMQASYDKSDSKRQSNIREGKVNPSKDAVSILFLELMIMKVVVKWPNYRTFKNGFYDSFYLQS